MAIMANTCGWISHHLIKDGIITVVVARKLFNSIGQYGSAIGLFWVAFVGCDYVSAVLALSLACGLNGAVFAGYQVDIQLANVSIQQ